MCPRCHHSLFPPSLRTLVILIPIVVNILTLVVSAIDRNPGRTFPLDVQLHPLIRHVLEVEPNLELDILAKISDSDAVLTRSFLSRAHRRAAQQIEEWMMAAGLDVSVDAIFNVRGTIPGNCDGKSGQENLVVGSHYDTVTDAGKYDGALGIVAGISSAKALILEALIAANGIESLEKLHLENGEWHKSIIDIRSYVTLQNLSFDPPKLCLQVVAFSDEEGTRFKSTFLGSKTLVGSLLSEGGSAGASNVLDVRDATGTSLREALLSEFHGDKVDSETLYRNLQAASLLYKADHTIKGYVEVHLEQGPVLESKGLPLGVVSHIAGQIRAVIMVTGRQGHAGTVPMGDRKDAMAGAAEIVMEIERLCSLEQVPINAKSTWLVCTVGSIDVHPGAVNVIPGQVTLSLDVRAQEEGLLMHTMTRMNTTVSEDVCQRRGLVCRVELLYKTNTIECDPVLTSQLQQAVDFVLAELSFQKLINLNTKTPLCDSCFVPNANVCDVTYTTESGEGLKGSMVSGAGHDAVAMASAGPVAMMFVRCRGGISHSPEEFVSGEDVGLATLALFYFLKQHVVPFMVH